METSIETRCDSELWGLVVSGDISAFEAIVSRYQNLLCSVAYCRCGDFSQSEDLAQEAFWAAWESRDSLREPAKLRSWLCGIVRHLALGHLRRTPMDLTMVRSTSNANFDEATSDDDPAVNALQREEQDLIWQTLEEIPESYREPLVLFYREEQSVAEVASALDLSEDTIKQRLSRGRALLRDRMADMVEVALRHSRPTTAFTISVMTGISASAGGKMALAGGGSVAAISATTSSLATLGKVTLGSVLGGVIGSAIGIFGGYLGFSIPAAFAPTRRERDYLLSVGKRTVLVSLGFVIAIGVARYALARGSMGQFVMIWNLFLVGYLTVEILFMQRKIIRIRAETTPANDPNPASASAWMTAQSQKWEKRHYCSSWRLFGVPLLHLNAVQSTDAPVGHIPWTTGWIAIGDKAQGVVAIGGVARGLIAIGGMAIGGVALGGITTGLLAIGGLTMGLLAIGGTAFGREAFGGIAFATSLAAGGKVYSWDSGVGALASAPHANDDIARAALAQHESLMLVARWGQTHPLGASLLLIAGSGLLTVSMILAHYQRKTNRSCGGQL